MNKKQKNCCLYFNIYCGDCREHYCDEIDPHKQTMKELENAEFWEEDYCTGCKKLEKINKEK